jgi:hypothetical protein
VLSFLVLYKAGRGVLHERAVATLDARTYQGAAPSRVAAVPGPVNPFRWRGIVETPQFSGVVDLNLLDEFDPAATTIFYKPEPAPAIQAANSSQVFRDFFRFSQFPVERITPLSSPAGATLVEAVDLRFGTPLQPGFLATAEVNSRLQVTRSWFTYGPLSRGSRPVKGF